MTASIYWSLALCQAWSMRRWLQSTTLADKVNSGSGCYCGFAWQNNLIYSHLPLHKSLREKIIKLIDETWGKEVSSLRTKRPQMVKWRLKLRLEKEMANHSNVLAWRIPAMTEPGGLPSMGLHRVGHDLAAACYFESRIWKFFIIANVCGKNITD